MLNSFFRKNKAIACITLFTCLCCSQSIVAKNTSSVIDNKDRGVKEIRVIPENGVLKFSGAFEEQYSQTIIIENNTKDVVTYEFELSASQYSEHITLPENGELGSFERASREIILDSGDYDSKGSFILNIVIKRKGSVVIRKEMQGNVHQRKFEYLDMRPVDIVMGKGDVEKIILNPVGAIIKGCYGTGGIEMKYKFNKGEYYVYDAICGDLNKGDNKIVVLLETEDNESVIYKIDVKDGSVISYKSFWIRDIEKVVMSRGGKHVITNVLTPWYEDKLPEIPKGKSAVLGHVNNTLEVTWEISDEDVVNGFAELTLEFYDYKLPVLRVPVLLVGK